METATLTRKVGRSMTLALTARLSETELHRIFGGVRFEELGDFEAPEPSLGAAVQLGTGVIAVLSWGKLSHELLVDLPRGASVPSFLREVNIPAKAITWSRSDRVSPKKAALASGRASRRARDSRHTERAAAAGSR
jgi:hypothetical protein